MKKNPIMTAVAYSRPFRLRIVILGLLAFVPTASYAEDRVNCEELDKKVEALRGATSDKVLPADAHACEKLQHQKELNQGAGGPIYQASMERDLTDCLQTKCDSQSNIFTLVTQLCASQDAPKEPCKVLKPAPEVPKNQLPLWRKGLGGALIGVGALPIILGAIHLGVPLFITPGSNNCIDHGLGHPCAADRYPTGVSLIVVGVLAGVGGILTLKLP